MARESYDGAPFIPDLPQWARKAAEAIANILGGKLNNVTEVTLAAGAATTTLTDPRIGYYSAIALLPQTANAAAALGTTYVSAQTQGSATITHANAATVDRTFRVTITG